MNQRQEWAQTSAGDPTRFRVHLLNRDTAEGRVNVNEKAEWKCVCVWVRGRSRLTAAARSHVQVVGDREKRKGTRREDVEQEKERQPEG
jgi:hypothetical protein